MSQYTMRSGLKVSEGSPYLLGSTLESNGCNFALFSKNATSVTLLLFNDYTDSRPAYRISFNDKINKTGDIWHIFICGIRAGQYYGYSVDGPYQPVKFGHRFNKNKLLIDPYTKAVSGRYYWNGTDAYGYSPNSRLGDLSFNKQNNFGSVVKSIVVGDFNFNWEGDRPLNIPMYETIIYEIHVRGFTQDKTSGIKHPGTYLGIAEKIDYLKDLGITTLELMPVQEFNELENIKKNPVTGEKLKNFWGYSPLAFFAPDSWYSTDRTGLSAVIEFKEMVKALHKAGIEVILDVVYNHTGEGNEYGPTLSFRGLDNSIYYMLENGRNYKNYSGCGNTLNCNHPVVKKLIIDSLRYWVIDMHIDGFRFDLAAILGRDENGNWVPNYSVLSEISHDPILSNTKIIAEGWDAAGLYEVGGFPPGWAEWNAQFRDDVRCFVKGDNDKVESLSKRIAGSADLFSFKERRPYQSINFITVHDGFTLNDLVSYNEKHNEENGENNSDGLNYNASWNCGNEGPTGDQSILELRDRQMKNLLALLLLSQGTPMIASGDEMKFTKRGNNNTYCHDNSYNWLDWESLSKNNEFFQYCRFLVSFRKSYSVFNRKSFIIENELSGNLIPQIVWHGVIPYKPDCSEESHSIAFQLIFPRDGQRKIKDRNSIYMALNAYWEDLNFTLPPAVEKKGWLIFVDTSEIPSFFIKGKDVNRDEIIVKSRSLIILSDRL